MASARKDRRLAEVTKYLKACRDLAAEGEHAGERALFVLLARHGTKEGARRALQALWKRYVDINEFRAAKATEVAGLIQSSVKNDPYRVAEQLRGFLWRYHKDQHTLDFGVARSLTPEQLKRYFAGLDAYPREVALAIFLDHCAAEERHAEEAQATETEEKPKKRPDRDLTASLERLALACAVAVHGTVPSKAKIAQAPRQLLKAFAFQPLPPPPQPAPAKAESKRGGKSAKKTSRKTTAKTTTKKSATNTNRKSPTSKKKTARKTTKKSTPSPRGGGASRPRTTRATRTRRSTKKSSRR